MIQVSTHAFSYAFLETETYLLELEVELQDSLLDEKLAPTIRTE